jgi:hypothetical protein
MKYLEGEGKDPATGEPLTEDDLIPVKASKGTPEHTCPSFHVYPFILPSIWDIYPWRGNSSLSKGRQVGGGGSQTDVRGR